VGAPISCTARIKNECMGWMFGLTDRLVDHLSGLMVFVS